jgi:shikimate kinase
MNIVLTGLRGSGKSTVGKILAKKLNKKFLDLDELIESNISKTIHQLVESEGWDAFRKAEHRAVKEVSTLSNTVIACGGGTICYFDNAVLLKKSGTIVFLQISPGMAAERIRHSQNRPNLTRRNNEMKEIWNKRKESYLSTADLIIQSGKKNPHGIAEEIITHLQV